MNKCQLCEQLEQEVDFLRKKLTKMINYVKDDGPVYDTSDELEENST